MQKLIDLRNKMVLIVALYLFKKIYRFLFKLIYLSDHLVNLSLVDFTKTISNILLYRDCAYINYS